MIRRKRRKKNDLFEIVEQDLGDFIKVHIFDKREWRGFDVFIEKPKRKKK